MIIKKFNGLNVVIDKKLELMLAIHTVYLKKHPDACDELGFIEIPPIDYIDELDVLLSSNNHQKLIDAILEFEYESTCVEVALSLNEIYELDKCRVNIDKISKYMGSINLEDFVNEFKKFAEKIEWDNFFDSHKDYYLKMFSAFCNFPYNLDLSDMEKYYGVTASSYNYIPSILMNGGFSYSDLVGNLYYIRGIQWSKEKNNFSYEKEYLLECMFHEFSHPIVNSLVDKYLPLFTKLDDIHHDALMHNLPTSYNDKRVLLYEYFVRTNAHILTRKYYSDVRTGDWIINHGFPYLNDIIDFTIKNITKYDNYDDFFKNELICYFNELL